MFADIFLHTPTCYLPAHKFYERNNFLNIRTVPRYYSVSDGDHATTAFIFRYGKSFKNLIIWKLMFWNWFCLKWNNCSERHKARQQFLGRENMRPKNRCLAFKKHENPKTVARIAQKSAKVSRFQKVSGIFSKRFKNICHPIFSYKLSMLSSENKLDCSAPRPAPASVSVWLIV